MPHFWIPYSVHVEKAMAPHSSTLAWKIPWMEEAGGLQSMGSRRVGHDWATSLSLFTFMHWRRKWQPTPVFLPGESQGRGAWWAAVSGVAQSRTRLKRLSSSSSSSTFLWLSSIYLLLFGDSTLKTSWGKKQTFSTIPGVRWSLLGLFPYSGSEQKREAWPIRGFSPLITVITSGIDTCLLQSMTHDKTYINGVRKTGSVSCWTWTGRI